MMNYELFAQFYDDTPLGDRKERVARLVRGLLKGKVDDHSTLLEAACGTGNIMHELSDEYEVEGFDISEAMIAIARKKMPDVTVSVGDLRTFDVHKTYDSIICVFDSLNHLQSLREWEQAFGRFDAHLKKGGVLVIDMLTEFSYALYLNEPAVVDRFGNDNQHFMIRETLPTDSPRSVFWNFKIFEHLKGDTYRMHEENIQERTYPLQDVLQLAHRFFDVQMITDYEGNPVESEEGQERLYLVMRKKALSS